MIQEPRTIHYNVYYNPKTGQNETLFGRSRSGAAWERGAVKDNWWGAGHLVPAYLVKVTEKLPVTTA